MIRRKSKDGDERLIHDEAAGVAERASAIFRLAVDDYKDMEPYLVELLKHKESLLREESVKVLLGGWGEEKHLDKAFQMLHHDSDYLVRSSTAFSLGEFVNRFVEKQSKRKSVLIELIKQLQDDENSFVQRQCYQSALEIIQGKRVGIKVPDDFDSKLHVDWKLLDPYLEK